MRRIDALFAAITVLLGGWIAYMAIGYGYSVDGNFGPGFFPFWVGLLIVALGVINALRAIFGLEELKEAFDRTSVLKTVGIAVAIAAFVLASPWIGMLVGSTLLVLVIGILIRLQWDRIFAVKLAAVAIGFPVAAYLIFSVYLNVRLVEGALGL